MLASKTPESVCGLLARHAPSSAALAAVVPQLLAVSGNVGGWAPFAATLDGPDARRLLAGDHSREMAFAVALLCSDPDVLDMLARAWTAQGSESMFSVLANNPATSILTRLRLPRFHVTDETIAAAFAAAPLDDETVDALWQSDYDPKLLGAHPQLHAGLALRLLSSAEVPFSSWRPAPAQLTWALARPAATAAVSAAVLAESIHTLCSFAGIVPWFESTAAPAMVALHCLVSAGEHLALGAGTVDASVAAALARVPRHLDDLFRSHVELDDACFLAMAATLGDPSLVVPLSQWDELADGARRSGLYGLGVLASQPGCPSEVVSAAPVEVEAVARLLPADAVYWELAAGLLAGVDDLTTVGEFLDVLAGLVAQ